MHYNSDDKESLTVSAIITVLITSLGFIAMTLVLFGCQYLPQVAESIEQIATDDAISIQIDKDAFQKDTDVSVTVQIKNKET